MGLLVASVLAGSADRGSWSLWERYAERFISGDGRVVEQGPGSRTTSGGQAYALFFALVAGDRATFDRLLLWTEDNLAQGDLARSLPAQQWGRAESRGSWGVLDASSAADADLWLAYSLLEAGRLWNAPDYARKATAVLSLMDEREVADLPGLGPMLLPGPEGFEVEKGRAWRLNPSHLPPQLLRRLASVGVGGRWGQILASAGRLQRTLAKRGLAPDWILYRTGAGFEDDPIGGTQGSHDAIRVYLWSATLSRRDPLWASWLESTRGLTPFCSGADTVPEQIDVRSGLSSGRGPPGFTAVALVQAAARGERGLTERLARRLQSTRRDGLFGEPPAHYDQNLALFALGHRESRYRFAADGRLVTAWERR
ncbi:MAG: cellulase [Deltaproteobacteria bacterium]|nr:cellulase [Deltaproteobacteria bacterium]